MKSKRTGKQKLTLEQVSEIRRRLAEGEKARLLAIEFDVTFGHLCNIRDGRVWPKYRPIVDDR